MSQIKVLPSNEKGETICYVIYEINKILLFGPSCSYKNLSNMENEVEYVNKHWWSRARRWNSNYFSEQSLETSFFFFPAYFLVKQKLPVRLWLEEWKSDEQVIEHW